jgi:hypothetical protein
MLRCGKAFWPHQGPCKLPASLRIDTRKLGRADSGGASDSGGGLENRMQGYAMAFAGCAVCSLIFVYDTTPSVLKVGKIAVAVFTLLFVVTEILALVN